MTDYQEEQAMEVEALESIYMEDFTLISEKNPLSYKIYLAPNQDGEENHVAVTLKCIIPNDYPDAAPNCEVILEKGTTEKHQKEITNILKGKIEENMGMAMVFTLCEEMKEYLIVNNREGNDGSEYQEMLLRKEKKEKKDAIAIAHAEAAAERLDDEKSAKKSGGTPVTVQNFIEWKKKFDLEMINTGKKIVIDKEGKSTGRQLWLQGEGELLDDGSEDDGSEDDEDYEDEEEEDVDDDQDSDYSKNAS